MEFFTRMELIDANNPLQGLVRVFRVFIHLFQLVIHFCAF